MTDTNDNREPPRHNIEALIPYGLDDGQKEQINEIVQGLFFKCLISSFVSSDALLKASVKDVQDTVPAGQEKDFINALKYANETFSISQKINHIKQIQMNTFGHRMASFVLSAAIFDESSIAARDKAIGEGVVVTDKAVRVIAAEVLETVAKYFVLASKSDFTNSNPQTPTG